MREHFLMHHSMCGRNVKCECNYGRPENFMNHLQNHHIEKRYVCNECHMVTKNPINMLLHQSTHKQVRYPFIRPKRPKISKIHTQHENHTVIRENVQIKYLTGQRARNCIILEPITHEKQEHAVKRPYDRQMKASSGQQMGSITELKNFSNPEKSLILLEFRVIYRNISPTQSTNNDHSTISLTHRNNGVQY